MPIPMKTSGLGRSLLRDDVYHRLRDAIVDGTFLPGEQLRDADLAEWLEVSRTPVREALLRLGASGLVVTKPGRSTTVSVIDPAAVREALDVVGMMHVLAVRQTAGMLTEDHLERMRDANRRFGEAFRRGDVDAALDADDEFHSVPVGILGNRALQAVLDQFGPVVRRAERAHFAADGESSLARHEELLALLAAGDVDAATDLTFRTWNALTAAED
jgi:DNA-binding GntR family transcriptional regulator